MQEGVFGPEAWLPMARAFQAYFEGNRNARLLVYVDEGEADPMPVSVFFRSQDEFRECDRESLGLARGRVLDIGAGVGSIALALQTLGLNVTAVEVIPEAVSIMKKRGVRDVLLGSMEDLPKNGSFDTLLLLMNGIALAGTLSRVPGFLRELDGLLAPDGQILIESTDLGTGPDEGKGPPKGGPGPGFWDGDGDYPGEFQYQLEFSGERGAPFPQLFLDSGLLAALAEAEGFGMDVVWRGEGGGYLARLARWSSSEPSQAPILGPGRP
ncbi:MAG: class I SAM-dependent methyltransferase [Gemmatimonadetes bacterium]|nr:class I SAM-dependent methyltransferase [Gemmatimonadota bacterium]NNM04000.1 class I SAM-dependent methyltransferase [Gemmatimonadota bacterium]